MEKKTLQYYKQGYNCSQCLLKALESEYNMPISKQCINMCSCINTGLGIGEMCSVLLAGIMAFGLLFDYNTAKRLRIRLLTDFKDTYGTFDCSSLISKRGKSSNCDILVGNIAMMVDELIQEEMNG